MNPMLKIAYDYGCQQAIQDMEKQAGIPRGLGSIGKFIYNNPHALSGATTGALSGAIAGGINAEEGHGLRGALSGALGGSLLGGAVGRFGSKALMGKKNYNLSKGQSQKMIEANRIADPTKRDAVLAKLKSLNEKNPISTKSNLALLAGTGGAGVLGGLGAGYLSGANEQPWYQRMNPFG